MFRRPLIYVVLVAAAITLSPRRSAAASKEIQELQRDVALLAEQVKQLQQAQDRNFAGLQVLTQQALDAANKANTAVAVIQNGFQQSVQSQQEKVVAPVVGLSSRMDAVSSDVRTVTQAVADLTTQISKIQSQLTDLANAVKVMAAPAPQPPGATSGPGGGPVGGGPGGGPTASAQAPQISSQDLYNNAMRDRSAGNLDLALQEFADYLKYYGNTDLAPNAQYYIAFIHYSQNDFERAAAEFDMVLEKYPENSKTKDAMLYKGLSLVKAQHRTQGGDEFKELIRLYPRTDQATQACRQLEAMALRCPTPTAAAPVRNAKKKRD